MVPGRQHNGRNPIFWNHTAYAARCSKRSNTSSSCDKITTVHKGAPGDGDEISNYCIFAHAIYFRNT